MRILKATLVQGYHGDVVTIDVGNGKYYVLTGDDIKDVLVGTEQMCGDCEDTGEVQVDEYVRGELVGRGTITEKCHCQKKADTTDYENE